MKTSTYHVNTLVILQFLDYTMSKGLKSAVMHGTNSDYIVEITYTDEQAPLVEEIKVLNSLLVHITSYFLHTLSKGATGEDKLVGEFIQLACKGQRAA